MPATLERIHVSGFKSIRELDLELRPLNVLVGANGSGKSNFIGVFHLLNQILQERLQLYTAKVGAESLLHYGSKVTKEIRIEFYFGGSLFSVGLVPTDADTLNIIQEKASAGKSPTEIRAILDASDDPWLQQTRPSKSIPSLYEELANWKVYHFHDTSRESPMRRMQNLHDNERLQPDGSNIAAFLYLLEQKYPEHYHRIVKTIRRVAPYFDNFVLRPNPLNEERIWLQWRDIHSENPFNPQALSDGTLRFICLATLLMQPEEYLPSVILIDEPELGLHPFATSLLAGMLHSVSTYRQIILATQSVQFVNQFSPEDIIVVEREDGQSTFRRIGEDELQGWIENFEDYGVGDLWEKNVFGGNPQPEKI